MCQVQVKLCAEVRWEPKKIEPPYRIGEKLANGEGPCPVDSRAAASKGCRGPSESGVLIDVAQLSTGQRRMIGRSAIEAIPPCDPQHTEDAGRKKCGPANRSVA